MVFKERFAAILETDTHT